MFSVVFVFQFFRPLKVLQKFRKNYIKNQRPGSLQNHQGRREGPPQGLQKGPWRGPTLGRARHPPGCSVAPLVPPFGPIFTPTEETLIPDPFSPEAIPIFAAIAIKFRGDKIPVSAPCRDGEVPTDSSPSPLLPSSMKRE